MEQARFLVQWDSHPTHLSKNMCALMEHQILMDLTVICNSYSLKVHKCVLAASSTYFKEQLQKDLSYDRVVFNGVTYRVLKGLIEFMYCGEVAVLEEDMDELLALADYLQIQGIKCIKHDKIALDPLASKERCLDIKGPIFLSKNDKYRLCTKESSCAAAAQPPDKSVKMMVEDAEPGRQHKQSIKISPATQAALAKEEEASRLALELLQKDLTTTSAHLFVIDDTTAHASSDDATADILTAVQYQVINEPFICGFQLGEDAHQQRTPLKVDYQQIVADAVGAVLYEVQPDTAHHLN